MKYKNIFLFGSRQEVVATQAKYFIQNTDKLAVFYISPRLSSERNEIHYFKCGKLIKVEQVLISKNIILCYLHIYYQFIKSIFEFYKKTEKIIVISYHPIAFFLKSFFNNFRKYDIVYWVGDYFPGNSPYNFFYRTVSNYYHARNKFNLYLSDRLNKKMNGRIRKDERKTVVWGIENKNNYRKPGHDFNLCFVGLLKPSQGIEDIIRITIENKLFRLSILGFAPGEFEEKIRKKIKIGNAQNRIFFPNKSYYGKDLEKELKKGDVGVALYNTGPKNGSYYADPAKIKTYIQNGLPVVMTDIADVAKTVRKFGAGIVVKRNDTEVVNAILKIKKDYKKFKNGVKSFTKHFEYKKYYSKQFAFLENYWKNENK